MPKDSRCEICGSTLNLLEVEFKDDGKVRNGYICKECEA
jgi:uncharacterized OB-fold protein